MRTGQLADFAMWISCVSEQAETEEIIEHNYFSRERERRACTSG